MTDDEKALRLRRKQVEFTFRYGFRGTMDDLIKMLVKQKQAKGKKHGKTEEKIQ